MTFREKLAQEHPQNIGAQYGGCCHGCPSDYGYTEIRPCANGPASCEDCWNREIPEQEKQPEAPDMVNKPPHYTAGGIECIDAIGAALSSHRDPLGAWLTGQVIKYLWRWPLKNGVEDLKKAKFYLDRLIQREEAAE